MLPSVGSTLNRINSLILSLVSARTVVLREENLLAFCSNPVLQQVLVVLRSHNQHFLWDLSCA